MDRPGCRPAAAGTPLRRHPLPGALIHAAADSDTPDLVADTVREALDGPVIHDHLTTGPTYYALVAHGRGLRWLGANDTPLLTTGTYLGVPALDRTTPPGTHWVTPPRHRNDLCPHGRVFDLILAGRRALRATAPETPNPEPLKAADHTSGTSNRQRSASC